MSTWEVSTLNMNIHTSKYLYLFFGSLFFFSFYWHIVVYIGWGLV